MKGSTLTRGKPKQNFDETPPDRRRDNDGEWEVHEYSGYFASRTIAE
jgi:hypothetical protein